MQMTAAVGYLEHFIECTIKVNPFGCLGCLVIYMKAIAAGRFEYYSVAVTRCAERLGNI